MADMAYPAGVSGRDYERRDDDVTILGAVLRRTSWGAVIAGAVVAISLQMIMTVLGIAIGVTADNVISGADRVRDGMGFGASAWWLITGTLSLYIGGCVVGRFAGMARSPDVLLHGLTMWAVTALFGFFVVTAGAGALYGTSMHDAYVGAQAAQDGDTADGAFGAGGARRDTGTNGQDRTADQGGSTVVNADGRVVTDDEARRYVQAASWWTLVGLAAGIAASVGGSWSAAPTRIEVRPPSQRPV